MLTIFWFVHFYYKLFSNIPYFSPVQFQGMVQGQSRVKKVCNHWRASCHVNITLRKEREDRLWGYCYCDSLCKTLGDCCVDFDEW